MNSVKAEDLLGRTIAGKYRIEALVGKGGFGAVYRATHHPLGRTVAVKIGLHPRRDDLLARFVREAQVQAHLRHPACVMLLDFGEEPDGIFYMVQEYVDGRTLADVLQSDGPLPPPRALAITRAVLGVLHEAHRLGIVHRDIKPANVMLTRGLDNAEEIRVLDFGIAKVLAGDLEDGLDGGLTHTGATLGTPAFMAPEQIRQGVISPTTDIYAVGAMLYRLCAGRGPFSSSVPFDILRMHLDTPPPPLPFPAPALNALIGRAMEKEPIDRFPSARAMIEAIASIEGSAAPPPRPVSLAPIAAPDGDTTSANGERSAASQLESRPRRRPALAVLALVAVGALIGFAVIQTTGEPDTPLTGELAPGEIPSLASAIATEGIEAPTLTFEMGIAVDDEPPDAEATPTDSPTDSPTASPTASPVPGPSPAPEAAPESRSLDAIPSVAPTATLIAESTAAPNRPTPARPTPARPTPSPTTARPTPARPTPARPTPARPTTTPPSPAPSDDPPSADKLAAEITRQLRQCQCDRIPPAITRLRALDPQRADKLDAHYQDECQLLIPDNCLAKAEK